MISSDKDEIAKLRREVAIKQKRENEIADRARRAEEKCASLQLENENLRAIVIHLGCPSCKVAEIAMTIHRMLVSDDNHIHHATKGADR